VALQTQRESSVIPYYQEHEDGSREEFIIQVPSSFPLFFPFFFSFSLYFFSFLFSSNPFLSLFFSSHLNCLKVAPKCTHIEMSELPALEEKKILSSSQDTHGGNEEYWHVYFCGALHRVLELEPSTR
jgi:hypothetical protein